MTNRYDNASANEIDFALDRNSTEAADAWLDRTGGWPSDDEESQRLTRKAEMVLRLYGVRR